MADIFDVVADPTRRDLMRLLLEQFTAQFDDPNGGELSVSQLVGELALSQPTVSKHLKVLRDAGLVTVREQGQHRFYRLSFLPLEEIEDWLLPYIRAELADEDRAAGVAAGAVGDSEDSAVASQTSAPASSVPESAAPAAGIPSRRLPPGQRAAAESIGGAVASGIHRVRTAQRRLRRS